MRRRRAPGDVSALREEARGLVAITYYGVALQADEPTLRSRDRLVEIAAELRVEAPPSLAELAGDPSLIDDWARRVGIGAA